MKAYRKFIALAAAVAMMGAPMAQAQDSTYMGGSGYQEYCLTSNYAAAVGLGLVAIAAIIAVSVQNSDNNHSHAH